MISAGQYSKGINPYGAQPRRPQTEAEAKEQRKKVREKIDKMLKEKIAEFKKADPHFKTCPIIEKDKEGEYLTKYGELCGGAKNKISKLLSHKPESDITLAIRKEKLIKVPKEEFLTYFQRYYLGRYFMQFKTSAKIKIILKKLKDKPANAKLKKKYNVEYWKFLRLYNNSLKSWFRRKYAFVDGKIYKIPANTKTVKTTGKSKDEGLKCVDRSNGSLTVYEDCSCAIKGGSTECAWLEEDRFQKNPNKPAENIVRGRIYYNPASMELRLIPTEKGYAPPEKFYPVSFPQLKWFLSRHKGKSEGGKKLLLDFLRTDSTAGIFRNDDGHYVVDVSKSDYLVHFNTYNNNIHKGQVFPAGIWLSRSDAKTFFEEANKYKPLVALLRVNPFRIENTAFYTKIESGKYQYLLPKDNTQLEKLYEFVDAIKKEKLKSSLSKEVVTSLHARLKSLCAQYLDRNWRKMITKRQWTFTKIMQIVGAVLGAVGGLSSVVFLIYIVANGRRQNRMMADQEGETQKFKEKGKAAMRNKRLRRIWMRRKLSWIPRVREITTEEQQQVDLDHYEKLRVQALRLIPVEEKEARALLVNGEEVFEVERSLLRKYPQWIVAGWEEPIKKYHAALGNTGEMAHPLVCGHSRCGKSYVHLGAFNHAAVDWLYRHEKTQIEDRLKEIFESKEGNKRWTEVAKASNEIFREYGIKDAEGNIKQYPETGEGMVKYVMARFKHISDNIPEHMRGRTSGIPDPSKMQAGTEYRGAQAGKQAKLVAAGEKGFVNNFQEVYEALQQGKTRDGSPESMGNLLKHAMGLTNRASFVTGIRTNINISADTTGVRALMMARDQETHDLNGRWYWIPILPWSPKETLEVMLDPSVRENIEAELHVKLDPRAIEAAVRLGCKLNAPAGSGQIPRLASWQYIKDTIANERARGKRGTIEITADHVVELAKENLRKKVETAANDAERGRYQGMLDELTRDPKKFGKEVMELPATYSMKPEEVQAYRDAMAKNFGKQTDDAKLAREVQKYLLVRDPNSAPVVHRMALMIAANETIGDTSDTEEIRISRAVSLARKLYEIYDRLPEEKRPAAGDTAEWNSFVNTNLEKVLPRTDADAYATTMIQEAIMRTMTPYKYADKNGEPNLIRMAAVADVIKDRILKLAKERTQAAYGQQATPEALVGEIAMFVEDFERGEKEISLEYAKKYNERLGTELAKYEATRAAELPSKAGQTEEPANPARAALEEMLRRRGIQKGTVEHYLATKFMDPDKFEEKVFVKIVRKAAAQVTAQLGEGELDAAEVDKIAKAAIATATLEMGRPDNDPDKDPTRGPGGKGGAKGPGGAPAPKPAAPKPEPAPKPASESDPKSRARIAQASLTANIKSMLPESLKPYAKHVAVICQHKPALLKLSGAAQRGLFTALANKAMQRHPEVIGGTRKGVEAGKAERRERKGHASEEERRAEELRRVEHMRRLQEMQRRRKASRG